MARDRYKVKLNQQPHFVTCTVVNWLPIFTRPQAVGIVLDSLRHLQSNGDLLIYGFVIMENHAHLIVSGRFLSKTIGRFKSFTARKIIDLLIDKGERGILRQLSYARLPHKVDREYQFWQEGSHPVLLSGEEMMRQRVESIRITIRCGAAMLMIRFIGGIRVRGIMRGWRGCWRFGWCGRWKDAERLRSTFPRRAWERVKSVGTS